MSLAMYQGSSFSSSDLQRSSTGAVKATKVSSFSGSRSRGTNSIGTSSSTYSTPRIAKQGHSTTVRALPHGPGPLPNRPMLDQSGAVKFVASSSSTARDRTSCIYPSHQKSTAKDSPTRRRKASNDSGYGSSGREGTYTSNFSSYGDLRTSGRKSKSLSHLPIKDDRGTNELPSHYRSSRTDSSSTRLVNHKTGNLYSQRSLEHDLLNPKHTYNTTSSGNIYRSTTHSDYKDPKEDRKPLTNVGQSYASDKDLLNSYIGRSNYSLIDVDKTRKGTITALPGNDLKCSRKSSLSSSNSSPSVSELVLLLLIM